MEINKSRILIVLYNVFAKYLPQSRHFPPAKRIRSFFANKIMEECGYNINVEKGAHFTEEVTLGDFSGIGINCEMNGPVKIGKYVNMGPEVVVYTQNHSISRTDIIMQKQGYDDVKPVIIEDDVWIGRRVLILPGVKVCKGSVIGAGSVVTKEIPPYSVVAGNPARIVRNRKDQHNGKQTD